MTVLRFPPAPRLRLVPEPCLAFDAAVKAARSDDEILALMGLRNSNDLDAALRGDEAGKDQ